MKIEYDKNGRKLYTFSHSISQGGYLYAHRTSSNPITNSGELRLVLNEIAKEHELIDVTIKVYETIFFLFFMSKPSLAPLELINSLQEKTASFAQWDENYLWAGVYDLQEKFLREYLEKNGYMWDEG